MNRTLSIAFLAALLAACGDTRQQPGPGVPAGPMTCGPSNCGGCCRPDGICVSGNAPTSCGLGGGACGACGDNACGPLGTCSTTPIPPVTGDACAAPEEIVIASGYGVAIGDTTGRRDDSQGTCGGSGGADSVFRFTTLLAGSLNVDVRPSAAGLQPVVYLRTACETPLSQPSGGCVAAGSAGGAAQLNLPNLAAGTYYLWIDGAEGTAGRFTITLNHGTSTGDSCAAVAPLVLVNGEGNVSGTTAGLTADSYSSSCGGYSTQSGPDAVYSLTTSEVLNLDATVTTGTPNMKPVVYLRSMSCTGSELACHMAVENGGAARLKRGNLPAGTYYLWVDTANATAGDYSLFTHTSRPIAGDICANAAPLSFSNGASGGVATEAGDTSLFFGDATASSYYCSTSGPDAVYTFTTDTVLDLRASVTTTKSGYRPALYLKSGTCDYLSEKICDSADYDGGTASIVSAKLPAGTYHLYVDGADAEGGPFALSASLTPPPPGDTCTSARPLAFSNGSAGGTATATGDTLLYSHDTSGSACGSYSYSGPDVVYTFTTTSTLSLRATVTPTGSSYEPVIYLRKAGSSSCTSGTEYACGDGLVPGGTASISAGNLAAGTYYLFVDGNDSTAGAFTLSATLAAPPLGDTCATARALSFSGGATGGTATASGDTSNFFGDTTAYSCTSSGPDTVYTFTTSTPLTLAATVSSTSSTYRPVVYLRYASCTASETTCDGTSYSGESAAINATLQAGTYYLFVDGANGTSGAFNLSATLSPPPAGDTCSVPLSLDVASGTASVSGNTSVYSSDGGGSCGGSSGREAVYAFTTTGTRNIAVSVTPGSSFDPVVYIRGACGTTYDLACRDYGGSGGAESFSLTAQPAGTYYVFVDGYSSSYGSYTLTVNVTP